MSNCTVKVGLVCFVCKMGNIRYTVRFWVLMVLIMNITVIWVASPCNVVFTSVLQELTVSIFSAKWYSFTLNIKAVSLSNMLVNFYKTTWYHIPRRHNFLHNCNCVCPKQNRQDVWHHTFCQRSVVFIIIKLCYSHMFWQSNVFPWNKYCVRISTILHWFGLIGLLHDPKTTSKTIHLRIS
jgi:hypothetical protein